VYGRDTNSRFQCWDTTTGRKRYPAPKGNGPTEPVFHLAFLPDGRSLLTSNGGDNLVLWDLSTRRSYSRPYSSRSRFVPLPYPLFGLLVDADPPGPEFWDPRTAVTTRTVYLPPVSRTDATVDDRNKRPWLCVTPVQVFGWFQVYRLLSWDRNTGKL